MFVPTVKRTPRGVTAVSAFDQPGAHARPRQQFRIAFSQSGEHRDNRLNLLRCHGYQAIVACHALRGSLQDDLSKVRLKSRRCVAHRNLGHHRIEYGTHRVDELWTVVSHDDSPDPVGRFSYSFSPANHEATTSRASDVAVL